MSEFSDKYRRSVALTKATEWAAGQITSPRPSAERVLEVAEKFRAFLAGETAEEPEVSGYKPRWVYFRYRASKNIYYRSDITKPETQLGNIERKGYFDQEWRAVRPSVGNPMTRAELRDREDYVRVPRSQVPAAYLK